MRTKFRTADALVNVTDQQFTRAPNANSKIDVGETGQDRKSVV